MNPRLYFLIGDVVSTALIGALVAVICIAMLPADWHMAVAMLPGMAIGMIIPFFLCIFVLGRIWGALELMVPCMLGGMLSGMAVGMAMTMSALTMARAAMIGVAVAWAALAFCHGLNAVERIRVRQ